MLAAHNEFGFGELRHYVIPQRSASGIQGG